MGAQKGGGGEEKTRWDNRGIGRKKLPGHSFLSYHAGGNRFLSHAFSVIGEIYRFALVIYDLEKKRVGAFINLKRFTCSINYIVKFVLIFVQFFTN